MTAGYSGTPLAQKLGYTPGMRAWFRDMPASVLAEIERDVSGIDIQDAPSAGLEAAHIFVTHREDLSREIEALRQLIAPAGMVWVSWPKQAAGVETDLTENVIREIVLPTGFVDVKVCAVDRTWSGLKLMVRKELRGK